MKNQTFILCALIVLTLATASCRKKKSPVPVASAPTPEASAKNEASPVVVKGFYIGMPVAELKQAIPKVWTASRWKRP